MANRSWAPIIERAAQIVRSYTSYLITLRQLHYLLVAEGAGGYRNTGKDYDRLSELTAEARRTAGFPKLIDQTREIHRLQTWARPQSAVTWTANRYRLDRTQGQGFYIVLGGEKATLLAQLAGWFDPLGIPIVLLRGYGSQSYIDNVAMMVRDAKRYRKVPSVLIYAGDLDASGYDILRDFTERCPVFDFVEHIAVEPTQIATFALPINQGKGDDSRAKDFRATFPDLARYADTQVSSGTWPVQRSKGGVLLPNVVQIEAEAIAPDDLRALYDTTIDLYWDQPTYDAVVEQEAKEREYLVRMAKRMRPPA